MPLARKLRRFAALTWPERFLFMEAFLTLMGVRLMLSISPVRLLRATMRSSGGITDAARAEAIVRIAWLASSQQISDGPCLRRSITAARLLRRRGIDAHLRIGGRIDERKLRGHAWIEVGGQPICDPPDIAASYQPFGISPEATALWVQTAAAEERNDEPGER